MIDALVGLGYGVVALAITIGVGTVVLSKFGASIAECGGADTAYYENVSSCFNTTSGVDIGDPTDAGWSATNYLQGQLGSAGLAGWVPAIIALVVGMLFLGAFLIKKGGSRQY